MLYLGGDDPVQLTAVANQIAKEMADRPGPARAARRQPTRAARNHHQAALRPRRRPRRDDRRAQPDDPHRDAWRHRAEQRQILAVRPPGADPACRCPRMPRRDIVDAREPAGADLDRRLGAAEVASPTSASAPGPTTIQRSNQLRRIVDRRRPRARASSRATSWAKINAAADDEEPAAGRPEDEPRRPEVAGRAAVQLRRSR